MKTLIQRAGPAVIVSLILALYITIPMAHALDIDFDPFNEDALCEQMAEDTLVGEGDGAYSVFSCDDDSASSFTNFEGDFSPPEGEGYAEGITQTSSAREFIVNVTNFVLGFLGLAAIVVVIYGGILYVTAAGEQERADKGKKSIMYAVIGIIIVLASYALVNTIIKGAATGSDREGADGLYTSGDVNSESLRSFQVERVSTSLQGLTADFVEEYTTYVNIMSILDAMASVDSFSDEGLQEMEDGFELIQSEVDSLSEASDEASQALQFIRNYISYDFMNRIKNLVGYQDWMQANVIQVAEGDDGDEDLDPYDAGSDIVEYMRDVNDAAVADLQASIEDISEELSEMRVSFEDLGSIDLLFGEAIDTYLSTYSNVVNYEDTVGHEFEAIDDYEYFIVRLTPPGGSRQVAEVVSLLNEIYVAVQEIEFTTAIISANTVEGNAPVTVTFNALDSYDPTDLTITSDRYEWDLLGDGFDVGNDNVSGPNVSYTYDTPGTYRVGLRVLSSEPDTIATGISYLSVKVNPPSSIIHVTGQPSLEGVAPVDLHDLPSWTVTGEQARSGITFDASETTDGDGNYDTIIQFEYKFGDGETTSGENPIATHYYDAEGTYTFELEVTDQNGVTDREVLDVIVASPAAHLKADVRTGEIGDTLIFSAEDSITDNGSIVSYLWKVSLNGSVVVEDLIEGIDGELFEHTFNQPGEYTISVEVFDSQNESNETSLTVVIASTEPVALFNYEIPDSTFPNRVHFDAGNSYDPDEGDTLTYVWETEGTEGADYAFVGATSATTEETVVDFYNTGEHEVTLTVYDQHEGDLKRAGTYAKSVEIESVLTIAANIVGGSTAFLDADGQATIELDLESNYGVSYTIDWGGGVDKITLETVPVTNVGGVEKVQHTYASAGTYPVVITVNDADNSTNTITRNAYIGSGEAPVAVVRVEVDNVESADSNEVTGNRTNTFKFYAGDSVDTDGSPITSSNSFSWDFGDGSLPSRGETLTHQYDEVGTFEVTLTVTSESNLIDKNTIPMAQSIVTVNIEDEPPTIYGISVVPQADEMITPLRVKMRVDAEDVDGDVTQYKFWYYDVNNSSQALDTQITTMDEVYLTINTNGETGEIKTYGFEVEVTDDENNTVSSADELLESQIPTLEVENGINQPPVVEFTVDKTNVYINDEVTFMSSSYDDDGSITSYTWDVEGDGFYNNTTQTESTFNYMYEYSAPEGIDVRLKVTDNEGATATSDPVTIYIDTLTEDPEAAFLYEVNPSEDNPFEVLFESTSTADESNGATIAQYKWDFDTDVDSNGNGTKDDDADSTEENPTYFYEDFGTYRVKLIVTDNEGNTDDVTNTIQVIEIEEPVASFDYDRSNLTVTFTNESSVGAGATIESYDWDFGDGESSGEESPEHSYEDYGNYTVKLTVTDDLGRDVTEQATIDLEEPDLDDLEAFLGADPGISQEGSDNSIHIDPSVVNLDGYATVTFYFRAEGVYGTPTFCIDQDLDFDSNGNGDSYDDCDPSDVVAGTETLFYEDGVHVLTFNQDWQPITVRLTVTDTATDQFDPNRKDTVDVGIVFDEEIEELQASASALPVTTAEAAYIFATALLFTILGAKIYTRKEFTQ